MIPADNESKTFGLSCGMPPLDPFSQCSYTIVSKGIDGIHGDMQCIGDFRRLQSPVNQIEDTMSQSIYMLASDHTNFFPFLSRIGMQRLGRINKMLRIVRQ